MQNNPVWWNPNCSFIEYNNVPQNELKIPFMDPRYNTVLYDDIKYMENPSLVKGKRIFIPQVAMERCLDTPPTGYEPKRHQYPELSLTVKDYPYNNLQLVDNRKFK